MKNRKRKKEKKWQRHHIFITTGGELTINTQTRYGKESLDIKKKKKMTTSNQFQEWRADGQRLGQASSQATCCCCCQIRMDQSSWASDAQVWLLGDQPLGMTLSTQNGSWISTPIVTSPPLPFTKRRVNFLKGVTNPNHSLLPAVSNDCRESSHYLLR